MLELFWIVPLTHASSHSHLVLLSEMQILIFSAGQSSAAAAAASATGCEMRVWNMSIDLSDRLPVINWGIVDVTRV